MRVAEPKLSPGEAPAVAQTDAVRLVSYYSELWRNEMSILSDELDCVLQLFAGPPHVVAITNSREWSVVAILELAPELRLFDRLTGRELSQQGLELTLELDGWGCRAFEVRACGQLCAIPLRTLHVGLNQCSSGI